MKPISFGATLLALVVFLSCSVSRRNSSATLILYNGFLFTADSTRPEAKAIAMRGDTILYVGDDAGALAFAGPQTELLDLQGNFAMPGFIEGHGHFIGLGQSLEVVNLSKANSWSEVIARVVEQVQRTPIGEWVEGRGWHQEKWSEPPTRSVNGYPYHDELSARTPNHPVVLRHASGHALMANAKAMQLAGISRHTPDPPGGRIVRDEKGNLTGVFEENAMNLVLQPLSEQRSSRREREKRAAFERQVTLAAEACLRNGVTSFQDAGSSFWEIEQFKRMAEEGRLPVRLWVMIAPPSSADLPKLAHFPQVDLGKGFLTVRAVKSYLDGALGAYGAWLLQPYADKPGHLGQNVTPLDSLRRIAEACRRHGLQLCVHAIGDRANREILNLYQAFVDSSQNLRWRVEHAQHLDPQDIARFGQLGVIASVQAVHCTSDAPFVVKRLGVERARTGAYVWRSLLDSGARLANGTDTPVEDINPLACIYAAVTRKRPDTGEPFFPEQCMTRQEALLSYTLWNAYAAFEEKKKGSLTPGKRADVIVLSKNLLTCSPEDILNARVLHTILAGRRIWSAQ
ncbi:MAG: amidohydrolase [Saprospiraceae bacterium]|nr:amidohydrolase [Saprospiraceae bacterium]MDW8483562.1 amidohydrolase [Saprospiraceae bacterium]